VDGSHIRTLLLTFFYRQMPELLKRGHIFIAQPPLYKARKGKQERYLKDDNSLEGYLLELSIQEARVDFAGQTYSDETLIEIGNQFLQLKRLEERLCRRVDGGVLKLLEGTDDQPGDDPEAWVSMVNELRANNPSISGSTPESQLTLERTGAESWRIRFVLVVRGLEQTSYLDRDFFASHDYQQLRSLTSVLHRVAENGKVTRGQEEQPVQTLREALDWLMLDSKRGIQIQRYKGLGEMNPDQLSETTMNVDTRNLLQVRIDDAVVADEIFSTLMGDQVEPRREFIERHALTVTNLDT
jgi:DNA gyrase subunit B